LNDAAACVIEKRLMEIILYQCILNFKHVREIIKRYRISVCQIPAFAVHRTSLRTASTLLISLLFFFSKKQIMRKRIQVALMELKS
jgi:hypothetical protein